MGSYKIGGQVTVSITVGDWERAQAFYGETLGLQKVFSADGMKWVAYATGVENTTIGIGGGMGPVQPGTTVPCLGVDDIEAAKTDLESKGVKFEGDIQTIPNTVKLATFLDPDGNKLMLAQSLM